MRLQVASFRVKQMIHQFFKIKTESQVWFMRKEEQNWQRSTCHRRINAVWLRFNYDKPLLSWIQTLLLFKSLKRLWVAEAKWKQLFYSTSHSKTCLFISTTCIIPSLNCNAVLLSQLRKILYIRIDLNTQKLSQ